MTQEKEAEVAEVNGKLERAEADPYHGTMLGNAIGILLQENQGHVQEYQAMVVVGDEQQATYCAQLMQGAQHCEAFACKKQELFATLWPLGNLLHCLSSCDTHQTEQAK